ncbi:MAG: glucose-6-phosphate dehydrogenase, partial [Gammaproteobacteria bacterium]|nr:glucose-6-phosphate dehydrogenase [Gammaproteobacteria bacterium]
MTTTLPSFDMLLFGGTGDLVTRKLLPALYRRHAAGQLSADSRILGIARSTLSVEEYVAQAEHACRDFLGAEFDPAQWSTFAARLGYARVDADSAADFAQLAQLLAGREQMVRVFFYSTSSDLFAPITRNLASAGVVTPQSRVVLEKPLGHDSESADAINREVGSVFD